MSAPEDREKRARRAAFARARLRRLAQAHAIRYRARRVDFDVVDIQEADEVLERLETL